MSTSSQVRTARVLRMLAVAAGAAAISIAANADRLEGPGMRIRVTDASGNIGEYTYAVTQTPDGNWSFFNNQPYVLYDNVSGTEQNILAVINPPELVSQPGVGCGATYIADPIVSLNFAVQAGAFSPTTTFEISSALLDHADITSGAIGRASAAITVTDNLATGDGGALTGNNPNPITGAYLAQYNGFATGANGTTFADFIPSVVAAPFSPASDSDQINFTPIAGTVSDMSSVFSFTLSRSDLASGTSNFEIVPEPASLALLLVGASLLRRRR